MSRLIGLRESRYNVSFLIKGIVKYINPVTGLSHFVYDNKNNVKYMLDENLPDNLIVNRNHSEPDPIDQKIDEQPLKPKTRAQVDNPQIGRLKRNISSPNLVNEEATSVNSMKSEPVKPQIRAQPIVNRSVKPMIRRPIDVKRSRIEELQPIWSTTVYSGCTGLRNLGI